jgi:hypothetical protein
MNDRPDGLRWTKVTPKSDPQEARATVVTSPGSDRLKVFEPYTAAPDSKGMRPWMKGAIGGVALVVAIVGVVAFVVSKGSGTSTPKAAALTPSAAFLHDVRALATGTLVQTAADPALLGLATGVCQLLDTLGPGQVETRMLGAKKDGFDSHDAVVVILAAGADLCPQHRTAVSSWDRIPAGQQP